MGEKGEGLKETSRGNHKNRAWKWCWHDVHETDAIGSHADVLSTCMDMCSIKNESKTAINMWGNVKTDEMRQNH